VFDLTVGVEVVAMAFAHFLGELRVTFFEDSRQACNKKVSERCKLGPELVKEVID
jgi:hypothetical protein